jgi:hypothetical protein
VSGPIITVDGAAVIVDFTGLAPFGKRGQPPVHSD